MARRRGSPAPSDEPELVATRYALLEKVGAGGVANVYKARDTRLNRTVALKILRDEYASDAEFVERFQREAHIAAGLSHPNIVSVDDYGRHGNTAFLAMNFVDGETLKARLRRLGRMPADEATAVARQVLAGLAAAHAQGLVHRDVKPHNVLLGWDGVAKLTDFGIALAAAAVGLTQTGTTVGTAAYAAPEQVTGKSVGPPADVYGVGLLLYEMLTGRPPFGGGSVMELAWAHVNDVPTPPSALVAGVPPELDALVMRALAKDPSARFADAATMLGALDGYEVLPAPPVVRPDGVVPVTSAVADADATVRLTGEASGPAAGPDAAAAASRAGGPAAAPGSGPSASPRRDVFRQPAPRPTLVPAALLATATGTTARLKQWIGARPSRAVAVPALLGVLALGGLLGAPRLFGGAPTPVPVTAAEPTAAVLAAQATPPPPDTPAPTDTPASIDRQLSGPLWLAPIDGPAPPPPGAAPTSTPVPQPAAPASSAPAPPAPEAAAAPEPAPSDAATGATPPPQPTATPPPPPTAAPPTPQQSAPAPQPAQPAPSAPPPSSPPQPTATPQPAATAPPKSTSTPAASAPTATTAPAATASPPPPTAAPTQPSRPPADATPKPTSAPQPTPQPTASSGG